jgi:hypothetical protein
VNWKQNINIMAVIPVITVPILHGGKGVPHKARDGRVDSTPTPVTEAQVHSPVLLCLEELGEGSGEEEPV